VKSDSRVSIRPPRQGPPAPLSQRVVMPDSLPEYTDRTADMTGLIARRARLSRRDGSDVVTSRGSESPRLAVGDSPALRPAGIAPRINTLPDFPGSASYMLTPGRPSPGLLLIIPLIGNKCITPAYRPGKTFHISLPGRRLYVFTLLAPSIFKAIAFVRWVFTHSLTDSNFHGHCPNVLIQQHFLWYLIMSVKSGTFKTLLSVHKEENVFRRREGMFLFNSFPLSHPFKVWQ
jgi:hypothetical protein